jgi:two-component system alkaline phosphatase synthesis response regulator PhoP
MSDYTILLIDYEPRSIAKIRGALDPAGFTIEVANNGLAGIEAFNELKPDLVLIEAMIPKKHGFEVCQELKATAEGKKTPMAIITAVYKGRRYRTQAVHLYGCDEYIEKPIDDQDLLNVCRKMLSLESVEAEKAPGKKPKKKPAAPKAVSGSMTGTTEQDIEDSLDSLMFEAGESDEDEQKSAAG